MFIAFLSKSNTTCSMSRISKGEWLSKGIGILSTEGYHAIRIDYLCAKFKITKGSFYHHFESLEDYEKQLLRYWEKETQNGFQDVVKTAQTPEVRLRNMIKWVFSFSGTLELSLRAWALHNKRVKKLLTTIEGKRIELVMKMYTQIGVPKTDARELAELAHAAWVGIQACTIEGIVNQQRSIELINEMMRKRVKELLSKVR